MTDYNDYGDNYYADYDSSDEYDDYYDRNDDDDDFYDYLDGAENEIIMNMYDDSIRRCDEISDEISREIIEEADERMRFEHDRYTDYVQHLQIYPYDYNYVPSPMFFGAYSNHKSKRRSDKMSGQNQMAVQNFAPQQTAPVKTNGVRPSWWKIGLCFLCPIYGFLEYKFGNDGNNGIYLAVGCVGLALYAIL